jgi:hypothetical protein
MFLVRNVLFFIFVRWEHKATLTLRPFLLYSESPSNLLISPDSSTKDLWHLTADLSSRETGKIDEDMASDFCLRSISFILIVFLTCLKILQRVTDGFTSLRRKSCGGFLSPFNIHRPRPGMNPRTLGPMASMLPLDHRGHLRHAAGVEGCLLSAHCRARSEGLSRRSNIIPVGRQSASHVPSSLIRYINS